MFVEPRESLLHSHGLQIGRGEALFNRLVVDRDDRGQIVKSRRTNRGAHGVSRVKVSD